MLFSFSSAMVMFTCNEGGWVGEDVGGGSAPEEHAAGEPRKPAARAALQASPELKGMIGTPEESGRLP